MPRLALEPRPSPPRASGARSLSYALTRGAGVLGVGGAVEVRDGVWQLWSRATEPMTRAAWGYALGVVREVMTVLAAGGARRFELYVSPDTPGADRFAIRLGFARARAGEHLDLFARDA